MNNTPATQSPFTPRMLRPGDCILYRPVDVFDWAVALKTWTRVSHVEVYTGEPEYQNAPPDRCYSVASRNGQGVGQYLVRTADVAAIRRPGPGFNLEGALRWFDAVANGQKYGWRTLLTFCLLNNNPIEGHMICSEFVAEFYKAGGLPLFGADWPSYRTPPSLEMATRELTTVWDDGKIFT